MSKIEVKISQQQKTKENMTIQKIRKPIDRIQMTQSENYSTVIEILQRIQLQFWNFKNAICGRKKSQNSSLNECNKNGDNRTEFQ